jgi:hypothetical protein
LNVIKLQREYTFRIRLNRAEGMDLRLGLPVAIYSFPSPGRDIGRNL